jgi:hypothetical protein
MANAEALRQKVLALTNHLDDYLQKKREKEEHARMFPDINLLTGVINGKIEKLKSHGIVFSPPVKLTCNEWVALTDARRLDYQASLQNLRARYESILALVDKHFIYIRLFNDALRVDSTHCDQLKQYGCVIGLPPPMKSILPFHDPRVDPTVEYLTDVLNVPCFDSLQCAHDIGKGRMQLAKLLEIQARYRKLIDAYLQAVSSQKIIAGKILDFSFELSKPPDEPHFEPGTPLDTRYESYSQFLQRIEPYNRELTGIWETITRLLNQLDAITPEKMAAFVLMRKNILSYHKLKGIEFPPPPSIAVFPMQNSNFQDCMIEFDTYMSSVNTKVVDALRGLPVYSKELAKNRSVWNSAMNYDAIRIVFDIHRCVPLEKGGNCACLFKGCCRQ